MVLLQHLQFQIVRMEYLKTDDKSANGYEAHQATRGITCKHSGQMLIWSSGNRFRRYFVFSGGGQRAINTDAGSNARNASRSRVNGNTSMTSSLTIVSTNGSIAIESGFGGAINSRSTSCSGISLSGMNSTSGNISGEFDNLKLGMRWKLRGNRQRKLTEWHKRKHVIRLTRGTLIAAQMGTIVRAFVTHREQLFWIIESTHTRSTRYVADLERRNGIRYESSTWYWRASWRRWLTSTCSCRASGIFRACRRLLTSKCNLLADKAFACFDRVYNTALEFEGCVRNVFKLLFKGTDARATYNMLTPLGGSPPSALIWFATYRLVLNSVRGELLVNGSVK